MLKTYGVARFADLLRDAGHDDAHASRRRLRPHAHPRRRRGQSLGHHRACTPASPTSRAPAPRDAAPRFRALTRAARRTRARTRGPSPIGTGARLAHARRLVRGAAPRRGRPLAQLRRQPRASPGKPARAVGLRDGWAVGTTRATPSACGSATPAAKAAPASRAPPWPRR